MNGWRRARLVDLCETHADCVNRTAPVVDGPTPFKMIRTTNVRDGFVDTQNVKYVTEETYRTWTRRLVPRLGDIVLTREAPLGGVGKVRTDETIFLGQRLYHFRANPVLADSDFLMYALMAPDLQAQIRSFGSGSTVEHMRLPDIEKLELDAPELDEQRRIAGILAAYDDLIENCERRVRVLEEMARALYREWFVLFRYPGHEKTPLVDSPLGRVPRGWAVEALEQLKAAAPYAINGGPFGSKLVSKDYVAEGVPVIRGSNLSEDGRFRADEFAFVSKEKARELNANIARSGDIVVTQRGTLGQVGRIPEGIGYNEFVISQSQMKVRLDDDRIDPDYAFFVMRSPETAQRLKNLASSSGVPHINLAVLREFCILVPPRELQRRFGAFATSTEATIEGLIRQSTVLRKTRDLLLPRLLSGQFTLESA